MGASASVPEGEKQGANEWIQGLSFTDMPGFCCDSRDDERDFR